jgi:hypothetical protein
MHEDATMPFKLSGLAEGAREPVTTLLLAVKDALEERLCAAVVSGAATGDDFVPKRSPIDVLLLVSEMTREVVRAVGTAYRPQARKGIQPPLVMTEAELRSSLDAFPVEFLRVRSTGVVVYGDFDLASLDIKAADLRLQCERELRGIQLHARMAEVRFGANSREIGNWLKSGVGRLESYLRAVDVLAGGTGAGLPAELLERISHRTGIDVDCMRLLFALRRESRPRVGPDALLDLETRLAALVEWIDRLPTGGQEAL